jgi:hypothetical protein
MASEASGSSGSSGSSRVVLAVAALAVGVVIGVIAKGGKPGGGLPFTCSTPGDHLVTVFPGNLSCGSVTIDANATSNSVGWQASDRTRVLSIVFDKSPFTRIDCSGPYCVAGPLDPNLPSGQTEYTYRASSKLPGPPPPDPRTPTPTPGVLTGRVVIIKP